MGEPEEFVGREELERARAAVGAQQAVGRVLRGEAASVGLRTAAAVKNRLASYEKIAGKYEKFIDKQAEELLNGVFKDSPYKELGMARLVAMWLIETEQFITENEFLLSETEKTVRKGFIEESFSQFPEDIRVRLLEELNDKKQELLIWFAGRIQAAKLETEDRGSVDADTTMEP